MSPSLLYPDEHEIVDLSENPGRRLQALRQARGIEIERIATQLHLSREVVVALEEGDYEHLPAPVFVAGYLRNYARLLEIDAAPLLASYRKLAPNVNLYVPTTITPLKREFSIKYSFGRLIGIAIISLTALGTAGFLWFNYDKLNFLHETSSLSSNTTFQSNAQNSSNTSSERNSITSASTERLLPSTDNQTIVNTAPGTPVNSESSHSISPSTESDKNPSQSENTQPATISAEPPAATSTTILPVTLTFNGNCWLKVHDAHDKLILTGKVHNGDQRILSGQPPYKIVIGNANAAHVKIGDRPYDLKKHTRENIARFSLADSDLH